MPLGKFNFQRTMFATRNGMKVKLNNLFVRNGLMADKWNFIGASKSIVLDNLWPHHK